MERSYPPTPAHSALPWAIVHLRPRDIGAILDQAVVVYRRNFVTYVGITALMQVPVTFVLTLANIWLFDPATLRPPRSPGLSGDPAASSQYYQASVAWLSDLLSRSFLLVAIAVAGGILLSIANGALAWAMADGYLGRRTTVAGAYRAIRPRLGALMGVIVLQILLSALLFVFPLWVWIIINWSFASQVIVLEGTGATAALRRSWDLVRGAWWRVFGAYLLLLLMRLIVGLGASVVSGLLALAGAGWAMQTIGSQFASLLLTVLYIPVQLAAMTLLYFDLRVRKEGYDLSMALDERAAQVGLVPAGTAGWPYLPAPARSAPAGSGANPFGQGVQP